MPSRPFAADLALAVSQGWVDERVLAACVSMPDSNPDVSWLRPEALLAVSELVAAGPFDDYERFVFRTLRDTGLRTSEVAQDRVSNLRRRERLLYVPHGKGRGAGKARYVPLSLEYIKERDRHVNLYGLGPKDAVFFSRPLVFGGGRNREMVRRADHRKPASTRTIGKIVEGINELVEKKLEEDDFLPTPKHEEDDRPDFELTPKVLRRTYACTALILNSTGHGGLDIYSLQQAMGHASLETTALYLSDVHDFIKRHKPEFNIDQGVRAFLIAEARQKAAEKRDRRLGY